ncbi:MAG: RluA family pseudouridine synthase [Myxococcota bacterium]
MTPATQTVALTVADAHAYLRVDMFIAMQMPWRSRRSIVELLGQGAVVVNRRVVRKKAHRLTPGDVVELTVPASPDAQIDLGAIELRILHEDDDLVVVDKSGDLAVHPASTCQYRNLQRRLVHYYRHEQPDPQVEPSVLHRLDRTTSGAVAFAKRRRLVDFYTKQFAARTTRKRYVAIVHGQVPGSMRIETPIHVPPERLSWVGEGGKASRTDVEVVRSTDRVSWLSIDLHTGRRHQIRVHLASEGHPLVWDELYGPSRSGERRPTGARPLLHAARLSLDHRDGRRLHFDAPVPDDMVRAWERLSSTDEPDDAT